MLDLSSKFEKKLSKEFETKGFIKEKIPNKIFKEIENIFTKFIKKEIKLTKKYSNSYLLNNFHRFIGQKELNNFRIKLITFINKDQNFRKKFFLSAKPYLEILVGNELMMQNNINLSIQLPNDDSSLLPVHSDVWSGDSPFEIVVWMPLVNCYKTKSMYILPPKQYKKMEKNFKSLLAKDSEAIFKKIKKNLKWINIKKGEILLFNQSLPHGNRVNLEKETRWSMNCRFKSIFSPYGDKKIGEFFQPITLKKVSELAMSYRLPE